MKKLSFSFSFFLKEALGVNSGVDTTNHVQGPEFNPLLGSGKSTEHTVQMGTEQQQPINPR